MRLEGDEWESIHFCCSVLSGISEKVQWPSDGKMADEKDVVCMKVVWSTSSEVLGCVPQGPVGCPGVF